MAEQYTPEEIAYLQQLAQQQQTMTPWGAALNQWGQGADYLTQEDTPVEWDRLGDFDDMLGDTLKRTGLYFDDLVDLPYQPVEDPGQYDGWNDYTSPIYGSSPAIQDINAAIAEGMPFDEAFNNVVTIAQGGGPEAERYMASIPKDADGNIDLIAFRSRAADTAENSYRAGAERSAYDDELAAYEDYVRTRTGLDFMPVQDLPQMAEGFDAGTINDRTPQSSTQTYEESMPGGSPGGKTWDPARREYVGTSGTTEPTRTRGPVLRGTGSPANDPALPASGRYDKQYDGSYRTARSRNVQRDSQGRSGSDVSFDANKRQNAANNFVADMLRKQRGSQQVASKEQANQAALLQTLAQLQYGGAA